MERALIYRTATEQLTLKETPCRLTGEATIATTYISKLYLFAIFACVSFSIEVCRVQTGPVHLIRTHWAKIVSRQCLDTAQTYSIQVTNLGITWVPLELLSCALCFVIRVASCLVSSTDQEAECAGGQLQRLAPRLIGNVSIEHIPVKSCNKCVAKM